MIKEIDRNAYVLNSCIANKKPIISKFRMFTALTGRNNEMHKSHHKRIDNESGTKVAKIGYFPCFSLNTILKAINVSQVDYFSLDVEGGELDVLKSIDFEGINIRTFGIEHNGFAETRDAITDFMQKKGYKTEMVDDQDGYYIKK